MSETGGWWDFIIRHGWWKLPEDEGSTTGVAHVVAQCEARVDFGPPRVLHSLCHLVGHLQGIQVCKK